MNRLIFIEHNKKYNKKNISLKKFYYLKFLAFNLNIHNVNLNLKY